MTLFSNLSLKHQKKVNEKKKEEGAEEREKGKESEKQSGGGVMTPLKGFPCPPRGVAKGAGTPTALLLPAPEACAGALGIPAVGGGVAGAVGTPRVAPEHPGSQYGVWGPQVEDGCDAWGRVTRCGVRDAEHGVPGWRGMGRMGHGAWGPWVGGRWTGCGVWGSAP